jgi:polyisoprenoid-binding protein YceI
MRIPAILLALLAPMAAAQAEPTRYVLDPDHTYAMFEISHLGLSMQRGMFIRTRGTVEVDWSALRGGIEVSIDATSIDTGHDERDRILRGANFFDAVRHPDIRYTARELSISEGKLSRVEGELTLLGVTRPVTLTVVHFDCRFNPLKFRRGCGVDAEAEIIRSDFGMSYGVPFVGDTIKLRIQAEAYPETIVPQ